MPWNLDSTKPIYLQLVEQIKLRILSAYYPVGEKLPPIRDIAKEAGVNPNTMQRAFNSLEQDGLIYTQRTSGKFVSDDKNLIESLKKDFAREKIKEFFDQMNKLGFSSKQAILLAQDFSKEMD